MAKATAKKKTPARPASTAKGSPANKLSSKDVDRFLSLRHHDPHQFLGPHLVDEEIVVRVFRPEAKEVEIAIGKARPQAMEKIHEAGLFAVVLPGIKKLQTYRLRIFQHDGEVKIIRDPYSFAATFGELDLHLFGEGKHEEIYQKLGAHVTKIGRISGVAFAVWAPHAEGVSVVG